MTMQIESTASLAIPRPGAIVMPTVLPAPLDSREDVSVDGAEWTPASVSQKAAVAEVSIHPDVTPPPTLLKPSGIEMWSGQDRVDTGPAPTLA